jgi:hypothetical protein
VKLRIQVNPVMKVRFSLPRPFSLITCFQIFHTCKGKKNILQVLPKKSNYVTHAGQMARDV